MQAFQISDMILVYTRASNPPDYLEPLIDAYSLAVYDSMWTAIFPRYFHGKCQQNGIDPHGKQYIFFL
jgi:hypothetical protein